MRTQIQIVGKASTISAQLREIQKLGVCPSGPPIIPDDLIRDICSGEYLGPLPSWDSRDDRGREDYLEVKS